MKNLIKNIYKIIVKLWMSLLSKRLVRKILDRSDEICLEVGAGNKKGINNWITIDMNKNCDLYWDLRNGIPFPSESIKKIYSSHFFEHLSFNEGQKFLEECMRVLSPGGVFSICVPNSKLYIEAYLNNVNLEEDIYLAYKPAYSKTTKIDYVNYIAYMDGNHKYMFDQENLIYIMQSKGMKNVRLREFDSVLDNESRKNGSIYAEAEK